MKFLIVDDSRAVQSIIKRILENTGYREIELRTALSGDQALEILEGWKPDLILTDWHMPGMTGLELLQTIRQLGMLDIKVGFVTTESSARHLDEAHRNGAVFVVNKPFNTEELKHAVLSVLQDADGFEGAIEAAAPSPAAAVAAAKQPIDAAEIASILSLSSIVCKIERIEPVPIEHVKMPYVIGIYSAPDSKTVDAVCLMDLNAACMVGGAMAKQSADQVKAAILAKTLNRDVYENCTSFLSDLAGMISRSSGKRGTLSSSHLVQKPFGKLFELMGNNYGRADFSISFPVYGDGFISVLLS
jgi:CheY-like chemotaxis protein